MTGKNPLGALVLGVAMLLLISSCRALSADVSPAAMAVETTPNDLALVAAAIEGVGASQAVEEFALAQGVVLRPDSGTGATRQGERAGTRLVLFHDAAGALVRADLYFTPATNLHRSELESVSGPIEIFQQSKDSHGRAEIPAKAPRPALTVFSEFLGSAPEATTPVRSVSVRQR